MKTKFRAWDIRKNVMREVVVLHFNEASNISGASYWSEDMELKSLHGQYIKLMQYANLNDSEDTEIYKGDIGWDDVRERYGIVDFIDGKFCYISENDYEDLCEVCNDIVIRGNIYQNKELLEGE